MTAPELDERKHRAALTALLTPAVGDIVHSPGTVPGDPENPDESLRNEALPPIFVVLSIERRYVEPTTAGVATRTGWRVSTRYVGGDVDEAQWAAYHCALALDGARLVVGTHTSTPIKQESSQAVALDGTEFSGLTFWTYSL